jgi:hypothetical protein
LSISFSGCLEDENDKDDDIEKAKPEDVELELKLDKNELWINNSSLEVNIIFKNRIDKKLILGYSFKLSLNITGLDNGYQMSNEYILPGAEFILEPKEIMKEKIEILDKNYFHYNTSKSEIFGDYSIQAFYYNDIYLESNIEYFTMK